MPRIGLVRYGVVPEVARCELLEDIELSRGAELVVETHRGPMLATLLEIARPPVEPGQQLAPAQFHMLRLATNADLQASVTLREQALGHCPDWEQRIRDWDVDLQLLDCEFTLDGSKQILYVLNDRGPDCTKLAIRLLPKDSASSKCNPLAAKGSSLSPSAMEVEAAAQAEDAGPEAAATSPDYSWGV